MHAGLQPFVNDATVTISAPTQAWSGADGEIGDAPIHGIFHADWRYINELRLRIAGRTTEVAGTAATTDSMAVHSLARSIDDPTPDPRVLVRRDRRVAAGTVVEHVTVHNGLAGPIVAPVTLSARVALAELQTIKAGDPTPVAVTYTVEDGVVRATDGVRGVEIRAIGGELRRDGDHVSLSVELSLSGGESATVGMEFALTDPQAVITQGTTPLAELPASGNASLDRWAKAAVADCRGLLLDAGDGAFVAAGAPWFLTLFGRDSLITARLLLPLSMELAHSTLRTLAARQGRTVDPATAEQPGKILHEVRAASLNLPGEGITLPPVYYGTIDATGLWVILLHEAWRAGLAPEKVEALLPALEGCLTWLRDFGAPDDSGYLKYVDESGHGLANQGWKDSGDSIRFADGSLAEGPIALAEVQAQACLAAENGAALLEAFGRDGTPWREWAEAMRQRFRRDFWVERDVVRFPAIALDGRGRPVDSMTSNIGQLIGTTLLSAVEERECADLLLTPQFASGFGLRTMAEGEGGYWPLSYHCGSVWTHDTAVAIEGMLKAGCIAQARVLASQLVRAADAFGSRMPELFAGIAADEVGAPVTYPASCRPQAWAAAAVVPVHRALTTG